MAQVAGLMAVTGIWRPPLRARRSPGIETNSIALRHERSASRAFGARAARGLQREKA